MKRLKTLSYSQRDTRWASELLGYNTNSQFNISNYGCLITSYGNYIGKTPHDINNILKANGGFVNGGLFVWSKCTALGLVQTYNSPYYDGPLTNQGLTKIKEFIDGGYPLICEIDFNPATEGEEMHFVLLTGYENDSIYAVDAWTGTYINLDIYGGAKRAIIQFRAYDKKLEFEGDTQDLVIKQSDAFIAVVDKLGVSADKDRALAAIEELLEVEKDYNNKIREIQEKDNQLKETQKEVDKLQEQVKTAIQENKDFQGHLTTLEGIVSAKDLQLAELQRKIEELQKVEPGVNKPGYHFKRWIELWLGVKI